MAGNTSTVRLAKNSLFMTIRMLFVMCITFYTTRVTLDVLGVVDYGIYNVICGFVGLFGFLNTSLSNGIQRFYNFELGKNGLKGAKAVFNTSIQIQLLITILLVLIIETIGIWYINNKIVLPIERLNVAKTIFHFSVLSFVFVIFQAPFTAAVMAHERMNYYAIVGMLDAVLKLIAVFVADKLVYDNLLVYGILYSLIPLVDLILYFLYCKIKFAEVKLDFTFRKDLFKSMIGFSGWNTFGSFSNVMRDQGINIILNMFFGPAINAARGIAIQINTGVSCFIQSIQVPARPQIIQSYAVGNVSRSIIITYTISKLCVFAILLMAVPVCYEINFLLNLWLGDNVPEKTSLFAIIIIITSIILILMSASSILVHASGIMRDYQVIGGIIKMLSVPIAYFFFTQGASSEWAFILVLLFDVLGLIYGLFVLKRTIKLNVVHYTKSVIIRMIPTIIIGLIVPIPVLFVLEPSIIRFLIIFFVSTVSLLLIFYITGLTAQERTIVRDIIVKFKNRI